MLWIGAPSSLCPCCLSHTLPGNPWCLVNYLSALASSNPEFIQWGQWKGLSIRIEREKYHVFPWQRNDWQRRIPKWLRTHPSNDGVNGTFISLHQQQPSKPLLTTEKILKKNQNQTDLQTPLPTGSFPGWTTDNCDSAGLRVTKIFFFYSPEDCSDSPSASRYSNPLLQESPQQEITWLSFLHVHPTV